MKSKYLNPLTIFIGILFIVIFLLLWWWGRGESLTVISKILFAPFMLDISNGVGATLATIFRWVIFVTFIAVVALVWLSFRAKNKSGSIAVCVFGIFFTIVHFLVIGVGYISTGLH